MKTMPICLDIEDKKVVVIGGGRAAEIKISYLCDFCETITAYAPKFSEAIKNSGVTCIKTPFLPALLEGAFLVVAAADEATNRTVFHFAKEKNILCCVCGSHQKGDFLFPAHKKQGDSIVSVTTSGAYPLLAKKLCQQVPLPSQEIMEVLKEKRRFILKHIPKSSQQALLLALITDDILCSKNPDKKIEEMIKRYQND